MLVNNNLVEEVTMELTNIDTLTSKKTVKNIITKLICSLVIALIFAFLFHDAWVKYLGIYHTILEIICIFMAASVFMAVWHNYERNQFSTCLLAFGFLSVAIFDALHAFYFLKLNLTASSYFDLSTRYWVFGRVVQSLIILISTYPIKFKPKKNLGCIVTIVITASLSYFAISYHDYLPILLTTEGVTPIKIFLEYVTIILFLVSLFRLKKHMYYESSISYAYIILSILLMIPSELSFTLYNSVESEIWTFGHILKITSYYFLFKAIFTNTITYSYEKLEEEHKKLDEAYMQIKEEQIRVQQQEKLALLGQMGAGIVHETRNYLTTIKGRAQLIEVISRDEAIESYASKIDEDVDEVNRIISEFLFLSKPRETDLQEVSMYDICTSIKKIVQTSSLVKGVDIDMKISDEERYLLCDEVQIKQVILNISKNAVEAMENVVNPRLTIETGYDEIRDEAFIKIGDNGKAMSPEDLEKVGTMFYTTKKTGTGLGLNVCYKIIEAHKGRLELDSNLGEGTVFTIILPCIPDDEYEEVV